ncbi:E3 ubiquitin-protein ligase Topors-like [Hemicordylus capensis]|uniref:E3 ubiquitin-protein ligase Topors-like n=1 Tax=Hemicordylus capensis TaxID=884348 RepID=UPI00230434E4|nr:E3 ubiquitin-protein ligase Topors-like [Hemicordylus capensis]
MASETDDSSARSGPNRPHQPTSADASPHGRRSYYQATLMREPCTTMNPQRTSSSRRPVPVPDDGVLLEGLPGQPTWQRDVEMLRRLVSRREASLEGQPRPQIQEQEIIRFRRALYRSGIHVRSIGDGGRYRDTSAEFLCRNSASLQRLVPWLTRELTVLLGTLSSLVRFVQRIIMRHVVRHDMESQALAKMLKPYLLHCTEHFVHGFISFARCPFNIEAYDQHANYECPAPSYEEGSRLGSSIITISPDGADSQPADCNPFTVGTGQAPWDDETPGPSYSSSEQARAAISAALGTSENSDEGPSAHTTEPQRQLPASAETNGASGDDSSNNCAVVGYVKPRVERTPELVELSSDSESEASADGGKRGEVKEVQPIRYHRFDAYGHRLSKKRKSDVQDSHSRERHGLKRKRKHHSREKRERKRDRSRRKHRKNKKKSRTRDKSLSRKSQTRSPSSESGMSRDRSGPRSRSGESKIRESQSKDYFRDGYQCKKHSCYHRNRSPDGYEPRRQPNSRARTLSSESEGTRAEKLRGKRKYKSHHLESSTPRGNEDASSAKEERALQTPLLNYRDSYKKTASFVAGQPETEIQHKKGKKRSRSPTVEIIDEGNATDVRHHTKKREREENTPKSHTGNSPFSSPLVITIDSESDKDLEIQGNIERDSSISWSPTMQRNDRERAFPSPVLEVRDCSYDRANESDKIDMDSNVTTTVEDGDETPCRVAQLQESANQQESPVRESSSSSSSSSLETGNQPSSTERDLGNRFLANRSSLFARLKKLMEESHRRDS